MKLKNKKTGEIGYLRSTNWNEISLIIMDKNGVQLAKYNSLAELNAEWKDCKKPKDYWFIDCDGTVCQSYQNSTQTHTNHHKLIGNYFETREEAEKAVEKLKAWKRLKEAGFRFNGGDGACISYRFDPVKWEDRLDNDFDLLFGGEE